MKNTFLRLKPFLSGTEFSNGLEINIPNKTKLIKRTKFLEELVQNKRIIHLGCCDHIPLIENKIKNNTWLHKILDQKSKLCLGIDINEKGINLLKTKYNYNNTVYADITKPNIKEIIEQQWDYLILGEILEHVDNPISFLSQIHKNYKNHIDKIVITVPNAFSFVNFKMAKLNKEVINSDHRFWFSPYTLAKNLIISGFTNIELYFADDITSKTGLRAKLKIIPFIKRKLHYTKILKHPIYRDTIIGIADFNE